MPKQESIGGDYCTKTLVAPGVRLLTQLGILLWLAVAADVSAGGGPSPDLNPVVFQATILSKIPGYVDWPADALPPADQPLVVGLFGHDPFAGLLEKLLADQKVSGRKVVVKVLEDVTQLESCQVLFIPEDKLTDWLKLNTKRDRRGMLTVTADRSGQFVKNGGVFNLLMEERKFEIHSGNAAKAGLKISSKLLKISKVI